MVMEVDRGLERLIPTVAVIALGAAAGALIGLVYSFVAGAGRAAGGLRGALEPSWPPYDRASELALLLVSAASAVAGALTDAKELSDILAYFAAFLSSMSAAFFQNPLNLVPLLLAVVLRLTSAAD